MTKNYRHVIWDWNGTLLDDWEITARITIDAMAELGREGIAPDEIRDHYRRPLTGYFSSLLGREASPDDLHHLGSRYTTRYEALMHDLPLALDAHEALESIGAHMSQSLLSMAPDGQINALIDHHGLREKFVLVRGFAGTGHPTKRESLAIHCQLLGLSPEQCCLVGDTVDDFDAGHALGLGVVLVTTGMQARRELLATGASVADTLAAAAALVLTA